MTAGKRARKRLVLDESRLWSMASSTSMDRSKLKSILFGYLWFESEFEWYFGLTNETKNLKGLTTTQNNEYLRKFDLTGKSSNSFFTASLQSNSVLQRI